MISARAVNSLRPGRGGRIGTLIRWLRLFAGGSQTCAPA